MLAVESNTEYDLIPVLVLSVSKETESCIALDIHFATHKKMSIFTSINRKLKMRKLLFLRILILTIPLGFTACGLFDDQSTPYGYVRSSIRKIDKYALYADGDWSLERKNCLSEAKSIDNFDDAHELVNGALAIAGGKHSTLLAPVTDTTSFEELAPEACMFDGGIAYVKLPAHRGVKVSDAAYTHTVLDFLQSHTDAVGVVIDLRNNRGGNMYPMISAVAPLLPDGTLLSFKTRKRTTPITLDYVVRSSGLSPEEISRFPESTPVALLVDDWTGSSGEATLLCFRGLGNVRTFGIPTAGYASANQSFPMADGYTLLITTGCDVARTGEVFCDDPISPDVETGTPLEDALEWIRGYREM